MTNKSKKSEHNQNKNKLEYSQSNPFIVSFSEKYLK